MQEPNPTEPATKLTFYYHPPSIGYSLSGLQSITKEKNEKEEEGIIGISEIKKQSPSYSFMYALKSSEARRQYPKRLKMLFDFMELPGSLEEQAAEFLKRARQDIQSCQDSIIGFLDFHNQRVRRKELAAGTLKNYYRAAKVFCDMNDLTTINWRRISKGLPKVKNYSSSDRAPTIEEIRKLVEYPDRRIKPIVYAMASGGFRLGAWDYLRWKHVTPVTDNTEENGGEVISAKLTIYADEPEEYYTFITPEAFEALKDWMDFRSSYGEKISGDSWVMRDLWQTSNMNYGAKWGLATHRRKLHSIAIKRLLNRALWEQGIRHNPLPAGVKRHEWKAAHGYRKFYKSRAEQVMKPINVEATMGHDLGISQSYWKPTEREVLEDYLKAVDLLTINDVKSTLQKQVMELTEKNREENYNIKGKLAEKEKEIQAAAKEAEKAKQELAEMRIDMEQVKTELANTTDQIATMLEILTKINRNQVILSDPAVKIFLERKLGTMTNGKWGKHPDSALVIEPG
jgi:hypothetical protein